jgi:hypothetical protein
MSPGVCSLDVTTRIKITNKSVGAPITGKKIVSTVQVPVTLHEKSPPNEIYRKRSPPKEHSPPVIRHKLAKPSPKRKNFEKSPVQEKTFQKKSEKPSTFRSKPIKKHRKQNEVIINQETSLKVRHLPKKINKLLKISLKKEKNRKTLEAIQEKKKIEKREEKKIELNIRDYQIRHMNKRCKKVKLHHKYSWGVDQSRLRDQRDQSSEKPSSRKAISTERKISNLDTIKEINSELGKSFIHFRKFSQTLEREEIPRTKRVSDPEVLRYMKTKNKKKKEREDFLNLQKFAENSKKINEIHKLFQVCSKVKEKKCLKRKKQVFKNRKISEVQENNEEIKDSDLHKLELVYETSLQSSLKEEKRNNFQTKSIETREELKSSMILTENSMVKAAIKIQSLIRSFLVRARLFNLHEFPSSDEQIREILSQKIKNPSESDRESCFSIPVTVPGKNLTIDLPSDNPSPISGSDFNIPQSSNSQKSSQSDLISELKIYKEAKKWPDQNFLIPGSPGRVTKEQSHLNETHLKQQIILREAQLKTLESIKEKEMNDLQTISSRVGIDRELNSMLSKIVEKRYDQLSFLLEASFQGAEESFIGRLGTEEREEFLNELEEKKEELTKRMELEQFESPVESFIRDKGFLDGEENRPAIYKPKAKGNLDLNETEQVLETPQMSNIIHAQDIPENSNMFIEDLHISSESVNSDLLQLDVASPRFEPGQLEEASLEFSSSLNAYDTSLSGHFKYEISDLSHTPEYIPERPSAPLHYFDRESPDTNPSPMLILNQLEETSSPQLLEMTPELVVGIAELVLMQLISEHPVFSKNLKIDTSYETIESYCNQIFEKYSTDQMIKDLSSPSPSKTLELLQKLQSSDILHFEVSEIQAPSNLINLRVYINIENQLDSSRSRASEVMSQKDHEFLIDAQHIHNKAIFDAINEALNKIRVMPTGIPVPLGRNKSVFFNERAEKLLKDAKNLVLTWSSPDLSKAKAEEDLEGLSEEEVLQQVKEDNLVKMIYSEILENECKWTDYSLEEVQVKLELSDLVLFVMTEELILMLESN